VIRSGVVTASLFAAAPTLAAQPVGTTPPLPVCQVIATGGTIAMKIDPVKNAPVPALSGEDLLAGVPRSGCGRPGPRRERVQHPVR